MKIDGRRRKHVRAQRIVLTPAFSRRNKVVGLKAVAHGSPKRIKSTKSSSSLRPVSLALLVVFIVVDAKLGKLLGYVCRIEVFLHPPR